MTRIVLPAIVDLAAAVSLADTLLTAPSPTAIDGSGVERIGVAGLQLLLSAQTTGEVSGTPIVIEQPSAALCEAARLAGADQLFANAAR